MEDGMRIFRMILNILIPAGTIVLVCTLGPWLLKFFMPFVVGWCIALICNPLVKKKEKRQNEKARDQVGKNVRLRRHLHGYQRQQGIFEQVVIQGTQKLGNHQGQETFGFQQHKFFLSQISKTKA